MIGAGFFIFTPLPAAAPHARTREPPWQSPRTAPSVGSPVHGAPEQGVFLAETTRREKNDTVSFFPWAQTAAINQHNQQFAHQKEQHSAIREQKAVLETKSRIKAAPAVPTGLNCGPGGTRCRCIRCSGGCSLGPRSGSNWRWSPSRRPGPPGKCPWRDHADRSGETSCSNCSNTNPNTTRTYHRVVPIICRLLDSCLPKP
jgi:hypothetical protein